MNPTLPSSMLEDADKMKGDAIGNTMYSERWVLKTLMKLSQRYAEFSKPDDYDLDSDLEGDLGLLWDMTVEPDVAEFLVKNNVLELITDVLGLSCSPRLNEIMIGILGNLACQEQIRKKIGTNNELIKFIINMLKFTDGPTLIQLMRLLRTCIWNIYENSLKSCDENNDETETEADTCWLNGLKMETELLRQSLVFILASSRNDELLRSTLSLLESLFNVTLSNDDYFCKEFCTEDFVKALLEAINEILSHIVDKNDCLLNHSNIKEASEHWIFLLHKLTYHGTGMSALEKEADAVFRTANCVWVEQSAKCAEMSRNHVAHLILALELLGALLPLYSSHYNIGPILNLLSAVSQSSSEFGEEEEKATGEELKENLEHFCFHVLRIWKLKSDGELNNLKSYSEWEVELLLQTLSKKLGENTISNVPVNSKLLILKNLINSIPCNE